GKRDPPRPPCGDGQSCLGLGRPKWAPLTQSRRAWPAAPGLRTRTWELERERSRLRWKCGPLARSEFYLCPFFGNQFPFKTRAKNLPVHEFGSFAIISGGPDPIT